jgi:hypothetical protein
LEKRCIRWPVSFVMVPYTKKFQDRILILQLMRYKAKGGFNVTYRWIKWAAHVVYRWWQKYPTAIRGISLRHRICLEYLNTYNEKHKTHTHTHTYKRKHYNLKNAISVISVTHQHTYQINRSHKLHKQNFILVQKLLHISSHVLSPMFVFEVKQEAPCFRKRVRSRPQVNECVKHLLRWAQYSEVIKTTRQPSCDLFLAWYRVYHHHNSIHLSYGTLYQTFS